MKLLEKHRRWMAHGLILSALALLAGGCAVLRPGADPTRFYLLEARPPTAQTETAASAPALAEVNLARVEIPRYLDAPAMMVRVGPHELRPAAGHHWAEPLDRAAGRIVRDWLETSPAVGRVWAHPARSSRGGVTLVKVSLIRAGGVAVPGEPPRAEFEAVWEIHRGGKIPVRGRVVKTDLPWNGVSHGELAASLSEAFAGLGRGVAAALDSNM